MPIHVALAGGTGSVGREVLDVLLSTGKYQLTVFTRAPSFYLTFWRFVRYLFGLHHANKKPPLPAGVSVVQVNYADSHSLTSHLKGVDVLLSFVAHGPAQKALVDSAISAGVKRFVPNEWAMNCSSREPGAEYKDEVLAYLRQVNSSRMVLEYTLFQPGVFLNLAVWPRKTAEFLWITCIGFDVDGGRALVLEDGSQNISFTPIRDVGRVVAAAMDYEGQWPEIGGFSGETLPYNSFLEKLEKHSGKKLQRYVLKVDDLKRGKFESPWLPPFRHPMIPEFLADWMAKKILTQWFLTGAGGDSAVNDSWNALLPAVNLTGVDEFLAQVYSH
ncbi:hypothetical protein MMC10_011104 [Thelotrema lepadinum]|nr:hypothetical protein [Thelotrema lepadinum]